MNTNHTSKSSRIVLILAFCLFCSVLLNVVQFSAAHDQPVSAHRTVGTYCTNNMLPSGEYLVLDQESRYCRYVQLEGILDSGSYQEEQQGQYALLSDTGEPFSILIVDDTAYLFSGGGLTAYSKLSDVPTYINVPERRTGNQSES